jgi:hypothetical protein
MDVDTFDDQTAHAEAELVSDQDHKRITRQRGQWLVQQQEQTPQPAAMDIKALKQLLVKRHGEQSDIITVFNEWAKQCGTRDVASLLSGPGHFDRLLQHLQDSSMKDATRTNHLRRVLQALKLQEMQQLLQPGVMQALRARVTAAREELMSPTPAPPAAAAAGALPALAPGHQQQQHQQQQQQPALTVEDLRQLLAARQSGSLIKTVLNM